MGEIEQIPNHQVKVDNWPLFFLQRLHHFYRKKSHCDLTLLFSTIDTIKSVKVHKLVLHACTDYFESLDIMTDSEHGEFLQLSKEMHPDVVIPIISFMYTGKLEFPVTLQPRLYEAATKLRMTILTKLLDVQPTKVASKAATQPSEDSIAKMIPANNDISLASTGVSENNQEMKELSSASIDTSSVSSSVSSRKVDEPDVTLMPASVADHHWPNQNPKSNLPLVQSTDASTPFKTNNQIRPKIVKKNVGLQLSSGNPKTKVVVVSLPPTLPGRKLPVWKRKVPLSGSQFIADNIQNVRGTFRHLEKPKPTRFEWEEDLDDPTTLKPVEDAFKILSYDGAVKVNHPIILEADGAVQSKDSSFDSLKRSSDGSSLESPPFKRSKSDLQDMKEYGKQQQLRNEIICSEENEDDLLDDHDDLYGTCDDESDDLTNFNVTNANSSTPKPILKTVSKPEPSLASKRVRFSLEGKENNESTVESTNDFTIATATTTANASVSVPTSAITTSSVMAANSVVNQRNADTPVSKQKIVLPMNMSQIQSGKHHVKIVSEVLKKYPNLAKRENIKLRVVSKSPAAVPPTVQQAVEGDAGGGNKSASSLVSYIFLTNKSSGELLPVKTEQNERDKLFDVENKTGPWFCQVCDENNPIEFESYYTYRRHLVEVHEIKIDARICEYCGLKNSKRNHLLYHLYTKHKIDPPAHVSFPKCSECDYIALSDALLVKHKNTHDPKGLTCYTCNVVFKSYSSLQSHLCSEYHAQKFSQREGKQIYRCPYCEALFGDGDKLGKHIVVLHWGKNTRVSDEGNKEDTVKPQSGQQLQYTEESNNSSVVDCAENPPSSELESLNNVASGIATSLSLVGNEQTVIYYEPRNEEGQEIGREATIITEDECKDYIISGQQEEGSNGQCKSEREELETITIENDDSNSHMSNAEEINRSSCSDHDYTESASEDQLRHLIPVHSVPNPIGDGTVIQQIIPDQGLVFANQGNVVFQSPCVSLSPRVLVTSGKVVLPHGDQNVILSQVIPQTPIILSSPIVQQSGNMMEDRSGTIVFANPTVVGTTAMAATTTTTTTTTDQLENIQAAMQQYSLTQQTEVVEEGAEQQRAVGEEGEDEVEEEEEDEVERSEGQNEEEAEQADDKMPMPMEETESVVKKEENKVANASSVTTEDAIMVKSGEDNLSGDNGKGRVETSKLVDDWDETNDGQQNVENRGDGPSRPDFF